jgi:hypothetical protein
MLGLSHGIDCGRVSYKLHDASSLCLHSICDFAFIAFHLRPLIHQSLPAIQNVSWHCLFRTWHRSLRPGRKGVGRVGQSFLYIALIPTSGGIATRASIKARSSPLHRHEWRCLLQCFGPEWASHRHSDDALLGRRRVAPPLHRHTALALLPTIAN